jgi:hypothetical protein
MNRQNLINRLVARKLQPTAAPKARCGICVVCAVAKPSNLGWANNNVKAHCFVATGTKN